MKVIALRYSDQPEAINRVLDLARPRGHKVERERKEVLAVWISPNGNIVGLTTPPRRILDAGIEIGDRGRELNDVPEDVGELIEEVFRRPE